MGDRSWPGPHQLSERVASWAYECQHERWRRQAVVAIPFVPGWARSNRVHTVGAGHGIARVRAEVYDRVAEHNRGSACGDTAAPFLEPAGIPAEASRFGAVPNRTWYTVDFTSSICSDRAKRRVSHSQTCDIEDLSTRRMIMHLLELPSEPLSLDAHPVKPVGQLRTECSPIDHLSWENIRHRPSTDRPA